MSSPRRATPTPPPRVVAKLKDPRLLQDAMRFSRLNIRELSEACGNLRHRSTIGHLHSGQRTTCSTALAGRIEYVLRLPPHALFELRASTTHHMDSCHQRGRNAA